MHELNDNDDAFTIGLGDYIDFTRSSWKRAFRQAGHDTVIHRSIDRTVKATLDDYIRLVQSIVPEFSKKCLGYHIGNHSWDFADGTNSEQYLCQKLNIPYLAWMSFGRLLIQRSHGKSDKYGGSKLNLTILSHHGHKGGGGGQFVGTSVAAIERKSMGWDADIVLKAHNHQKGGYVTQVMGLTHSQLPRLVERNKVFMRVGCFYKSYQEDTDIRPFAEDKGSYADECCYPPNAIGYGRIKMTWKRGSGLKDMPRLPERIQMEVQV